MTVRTNAQRLAYAQHQHDIGAHNWHNLCKSFVRNALGVSPSRSGSAIECFRETRVRHAPTTAPPVGVPFFWSDGSGPGHVVLSAGGGLCWTNDFVHDGHIDKVSIAAITRGWRMTPLGWTEDFDGQRIYIPVIAPPAPHPQLTLPLAYLKLGMRNSYVKTYQTALRRQPGCAALNPSGATGFYGTETEAMTKHEYIYNLHLTGGDLSTPGPKLLAALGYRAV